MKFYTLHTNQTLPGKTLVVKEGFCWPAFLFFPLWAMYNKLWFFAVIFVCVTGALGSVSELFLNGGIIGAVVFLSLQFILGWTANDIKRFGLSVRGYKERGLVFAENKDLAIFRYFSSLDFNTPKELQNRAGGPW